MSLLLHRATACLAWTCALSTLALACDAQPAQAPSGPPAPASQAGVDLAARYPTTLEAGDTDPGRARAWTFAQDDIYGLTEFKFGIGDQLQIATGAADVGIGHCADGAVWAVIVPRDAATLSSPQGQQEPITHVWLRFHPREIATLFPPATVHAAGRKELAGLMRRVATVKMNASYQAGGNAMIPPREDMTVDVDVRDGKRRFFVVNTAAKTAEYINAFEARSVPAQKPFDARLAEQAFDKLWKTYDERYAGFVLRPEVDWNALREQYRPQALAACDPDSFAEICARMLRPLRDLHIWVSVDGVPVEVYRRLRPVNANPAAWAVLLGQINSGVGRLAWAVTDDHVGYIFIPEWSNPRLPRACDEVLEQMRGTRGLIVDVRLNGGGDETLAQLVAARFADRAITYGYSQYRDGPGHSDLTDKKPRSIEPRGPWRYDRPVVLLIGQRCMSSNESFVAMMGECPQVTTMGDRTCGSSGNPMMLELGGGITVSLPRWVDLLPDGKPLDERGIEPDIRFEGSPEAFGGQRDDLLSAALAHLRAVPLPAEPISGPALEPEESTP
jgi:hypothetical protein